MPGAIEGAAEDDMDGTEEADNTEADNGAAAHGVDSVLEDGDIESATARYNDGDGRSCVKCLHLARDKPHGALAFSLVFFLYVNTVPFCVSSWINGERLN